VVEGASQMSPCESSLSKIRRGSRARTRIRKTRLEARMSMRRIPEQKSEGSLTASGSSPLELTIAQAPRWMVSAAYPVAHAIGCESPDAKGRNKVIFQPELASKRLWRCPRSPRFWNKIGILRHDYGLSNPLPTARLSRPLTLDRVGTVPARPRRERLRPARVHLSLNLH
jgi:hypothetical protein